MRLPTSHGYAETAWLRESCVSDMPGMDAACVHGCVHGIRGHAHANATDRLAGVRAARLPGTLVRWAM